MLLKKLTNINNFLSSYSLKEFLPASYMKVKGIEKKVFKEHKKHLTLTELDAKVLYTKSARDLKTYGVAFFLVKVSLLHHKQWGKLTRTRNKNFVDLRHLPADYGPML